MARGERGHICRDAVSGLDTHKVTGHEVFHRDLHQGAVPHHPDERHGERLEPGQGLLGLGLLVDAEAGVEGKDEPDGNRLQRQSIGTLREPKAQIQNQGKEQDIDKWALKLMQPSLPQPHTHGLGQRIGAKSG